MNKLDMLKYFSQFDGEISEGDFAPEELKKEIDGDTEKTQKEKTEEYFEFYDDVKDRVKGHEDW